jgi:hypothetical protein
MNVVITTLTASLLLLTAIVTLLHKLVEYKSAKMKLAIEMPTPTAVTTSSSDSHAALKRLERLEKGIILASVFIMLNSLTYLGWMLFGPSRNNPSTVRDVAVTGMSVANYLFSMNVIRDKGLSASAVLRHKG